VDGLTKLQIQLKFSTEFMLKKWLVGSKEVQKCADVIYGWYLINNPQKWHPFGLDSVLA
jgi:hypothetical protein